MKKKVGGVRSNGTIFKLVSAAEADYDILSAIT